MNTALPDRYNQLMTNTRRSKLLYVPLFTAIMVGLYWSQANDFGRSVTAEPVANQHRLAAPSTQMSFLDNGTIRLGVDLQVGGAITWLSDTTSKVNLVNSWDCGRQIQMSYYSGPVPYALDGKEPKKEWTGIGWNPIQVGDAFGNKSKILEHKNDGQSIYVKCIPMHWPLNNEPGECTFECWFKLEGAVVKAKCRFVNKRPDHFQYNARHQELPAIYTNGPWYKLMTYIGDKPFTKGELTQIKKTPADKGPWAHWTATESWAALVDDNNFGVGIYIPGIHEFTGGFAGKPGKGGAYDDPTGYMAPTPMEVIDWNITHEYQYDLIVGNLPDIRKQVYARAPKPSLPKYAFTDTRLGWYYHNLNDTGWPIKGMLDIQIDGPGGQILGPVGCWNAADIKQITIECAAISYRNDAHLFWRNLGERTIGKENVASLNLIADGEFHVYKIKSSDMPTFKGTISQLGIAPTSKGAKGDWIKIKSIAME